MLEPADARFADANLPANDRYESVLPIATGLLIKTTAMNTVSVDANSHRGERLGDQPSPHPVRGEISGTFKTRKASARRGFTRLSLRTCEPICTQYFYRLPGVTR